MLPNEEFKEIKAKDASNTLLLQVTIKLADGLSFCGHLLQLWPVSNPAKPEALYHRWTKMVLTEFFAQGDREKDLSVEVSPFMDRFVVCWWLVWPNKTAFSFFCMFSKADVLIVFASQTFLVVHIQYSIDFVSGFASFYGLTCTCMGLLSSCMEIHSFWHRTCASLLSDNVKPTGLRCFATQVMWQRHVAGVCAGTPFCRNTKRPK